MRTIGIVGSNRKGGNTEILVGKCLEEVRKRGAAIELIHLGDMSIKMCDGCLQCDETGECHIEDGMNEINEKLATADAIIIGTPARWRLLSGELKVFFDRTNPLAVPERLTGKKAAIIAVGQTLIKDSPSIKDAAESVRKYCEDSGMEVIGTVLGENALKPGDILKNEYALGECEALGREIAEGL